MGIRTLAVWCPDWPVAAAGHGPAEPVAVVADGRVVACSEAARAEGVTPALRRRQAESRCSSLLVIDHDPARDARAYEPVAAAVETVAPAVEVLHPGLCALPARGPSRYYGSDATLVARAIEAAERVTGAGGCRAGIADGLFAASQAARSGVVVPAGETPGFLAELPVDVLDLPDLADRFRRLGLRTLGAVAALPPGAVMERFGHDGARAHRLARGLDERPLRPRRPPPDLAVAMGFDPPAERLDVVLFAARQLAAELAGRLEELVLGCTLVAIEAEMAVGTTLSRRWRHEDGLTPDALAERVRWQVEAWVLRSGPDGPGISDGVARLRLVPELVHPERGRQLAFWGERAADGRVARALARVQGMLGIGSVVTAVVGGGRTPASRVRLIPWGEAGGAGGSRSDAKRSGSPPLWGGAVGSRSDAKRSGSPPLEREAWPGRIPPPAPATVLTDPQPIGVVDAAGEPVRVDDRGTASAAPATVHRSGGPPLEVVAWAGPWPADERWWDPAARLERARLQVLVGDGSAHLIAFEDGRWLLEATYD